MAKKKRTTKRKSAKRKGVRGIKVSNGSVKRFALKELKLARKFGFKTKKPKKPSMTASIEKIQGFLKTYNNWVESVKQAAHSQQFRMNLQGMVKQAR